MFASGLDRVDGASRAGDRYRLLDLDATLVGLLMDCTSGRMVVNFRVASTEAFRLARVKTAAIAIMADLALLERGRL